MLKTLSFAVMHFSIALLLVYLLTGSWAIGGAVAVIEPLVNTVAFYFHDKVWQRLEQRRQRGAPLAA
ncbi:DUF2061 domain-containing protein [Ferrimonas sediminicola]|uniref:DUF2061 domain-containing protein n=1 Tax=Ferrimonas sediminicola TaxID=2569538 RepID=A0A4U1BJJ2_9GAMM|nr:DUF2061 domain-containing protein [Ferrimonas sediminicola]TKB51345.1 DUF2061 domain-containing protein [Ferrimonas sediminicola]